MNDSVRPSLIFVLSDEAIGYGSLREQTDVCMYEFVHGSYRECANGSIHERIHRSIHNYVNLSIDKRKRDAV